MVFISLSVVMIMVFSVPVHDGDYCLLMTIVSFILVIILMLTIYDIRLFPKALSHQLMNYGTASAWSA